MYKLFSLLFLSASFSSIAQVKTEKKFQSSDEINHVLQYTEVQNVLRHDFDPWKETTYHLHGEFYTYNNQFCKRDTITVASGKKYESKLLIDSSALLNISYGRTELLSVTKEDYNSELINTARYSPQYLLDYINKQDFTKGFKHKKHGELHCKIGDYMLFIHANAKSSLIDSITATKHNDLHGDVTTTFRYKHYKTNFGITYPTQVIIEKINGKIIDKVEITGIEQRNNLKALILKPAKFTFKKEEETSIKCTVTRYNNYIYLLDLEHTDDRVLVVEFEGYVLVAEAPLSPENGELIIAEVKKLVPNKPIKYFVFGHHHPHYLGGIRAFIHNETTILSRESNMEYVKYLAKATHSIQPDSLAVHPKELKFQIIKDELTLGKKKQMKIYFIGDKSAHTNDYLIYYFPNEKLLFQDDLCWIPVDGEIRKAGDRQKGLYNSIVELNLEVNTIIQSWPALSNKVKTIFPFSDLEKSVQTEE